MRNTLGSFRRSLTRYESTLAYALLGVVGGLASGGVVLAFEATIVALGELWGVQGGEAFETLPRWLLFALPAGGGLLLGTLFSLLPKEQREVGILHVVSRLHYHYGVLPLRNALVQFLAGALALASGQSGGREGPGVHLGGAINSLLGQRLSLPNNSLRVLIACGTAGGIAAAFNTPLAGVIFAMEVIVAEYTVAGFVPVMLAAVAASAISRGLDFGFPVFSLPPVALNSLWEIPFILFVGLSCGTAGALFIRLVLLSAASRQRPVLLRFTVAGVLTGCLALLVPEVLGMGYDSLRRILAGESTLMLLAALAVTKLLATSVNLGFGLPVGLIGPSLIIGACLGGLLGQLGPTLLPALASDMTLYVIIGMAATMGTVLGAPLAASLAVIELTQTTAVAMPALLAIVAANLVNTALFRQRPVHHALLRQLERAVPEDPLGQFLHRVDVTSGMDTSAVRVPAKLSPEALRALAVQVPDWCVIHRDEEDLFLLRGEDLLAWGTGEHPPPPLAEGEDPGVLDLTGADLRRWTITRVPEQATLRQAMDVLRRETVEAACVYGRLPSGKRSLRGIVTRERIERYSLSFIYSET
ncbi:MAG: chloride channel protein [Pseudohaliea sp.]